MPAIRPRFRWLRRLGFVMLVLLLAAVGGGWWLWTIAVRDLPDAAALADYEPPLPTSLRAADGTPWRSFARERRVHLDYAEMPRVLIQAVLAAEDKTFFEHDGLDWLGIARAAVTNFENLGEDKRPVGASTITQQVAKNLLLTNELSYLRKLREAVLAKRIENNFTKQEILELYLNQIFLGRNAYGVEAAAQAYFGKSATALDLPQAAYLAVLPKAPSNYNPDRFAARAIERRNWVLGQMVANGFATPAAAAQASVEPLAVVSIERPPPADRTGLEFVEEARRQLIARFGESAKDGPNSVYAGGLWVRSTIDPRLQRLAEEALRDGLVRYDRQRGWRGPAATIDPGEGWAERLRELALPVGYDYWRAAVVLSPGRAIRLGFADGAVGVMPAWDAAARQRGTGRPAWTVLKAGDVVPVARRGSGWSLRQIPEVSGAMVVQEPQSGRVLAMVGGFDARASSFNRATQAMRQPGSAFKPFVYAAALDNGFTPASIVADAPYCVYQNRKLGRKCFRNFGGGYGGPQTMRWGLEQSRNLMTVRLAYNAGMDKVVGLADKMGIGRYEPVLAIALGAGETTPAKLVNAYSMLVNGGRRIEPAVFDLVQDRRGRTLWRLDSRVCNGCVAATWDGGAMPRPVDNRPQAIDARTAYQVTHMLEGVIERGTATILRDLNRPIMGKTGTTNGPTDAWFVGGTPDLVAGIYIGFDRPKNLGGYVQGGTVAAPIWKAMAKPAFGDAEPLPFVAPAGVRLVRIDRRSGRRVQGGWPGFGEAKPGLIWEAFKPESEPRRIVRASTRLDQRRGRVRSDADFLQSEGGIY